MNGLNIQEQSATQLNPDPDPDPDPDSYRDKKNLSLS